MTEQIALEWAPDAVRIASLKIDGHRVTVHRRGELLFSAPEPSRTEEDVTAELRRWLDTVGIARDTVTVLLPREAYVLRRLELPDAPDEELPDLVRFQAATRSSTPLDELVLDFLPLPARPDHPGRTAIAFTIDRRRLNRIENILKAAGLTPAKVTLSSTAIARMVHWALPRSQSFRAPILVMHQQTQRVEILILDGGNLVFSHSTRLPEGDASRHVQPLKAEVNRSLVALSQVHHNAHVEHCYLLTADTPDAAVVDFLQQHFPDQLTVVGPDSLPAHAAGLEPLIGAVLPQDRLIPDIDFLHPRKKLEKPDRRKFYWSVGGGVAAVLALTAYMAFHNQLQGYEERIANLTDQQVRLQTDLKRGEPRLAYHADVAHWTTGQADMRAQLHQFAAHLPGTEQLYFTELKLSPQIGGDVRLKVTGIVHARRREDWQALAQHLVDNGYSVAPATPVDTGDDPDYRFKYTLDVGIPRLSTPHAIEPSSGPPRSAQPLAGPVP